MWKATMVSRIFLATGLALANAGCARTLPPLTMGLTSTEAAPQRAAPEADSENLPECGSGIALTFDHFPLSLSCRMKTGFKLN